MKDLPITMMTDGWMEKTGDYAKDMTLRDYFAAKVMMGLGCNPNHVNMTDEEIAKWSYNLADAMIKAGQ